ncbi:MAG: DUF4091 domain-containing protein [Cytophagales bacterium]|nr:DUF4091 domain-containing protein [Cytophagales bacterium]
MKLKSVLLVLAVLGLMNGCRDYRGEVIFEYVDPLKKVFPESTYFPSADARADVARGEYATFQFVLRSGFSLKNVRVQTDVPTMGNRALGKIKTGFVGYVPVDRPTPVPGRDYLKTASGYFPDPILDDSIVDVPPATAQALWITIEIPRETPEGTYRGEVTVSAKLHNRKVELAKAITVEVYKPVIEKTSLLVTNWFSFERLDLLNKDKKLEKYSDDYWKYARILADMMAEYRQNVVLLRPLDLTGFDKDGDRWKFDFSNFNKMVRLMKEAGCARYIEGGHIGGRLPQNWSGPFIVKIPDKKNDEWTLKDYNIGDPAARNFYDQFFPALVDNLESNGWLDIYLQHIADEPIESNKESYAEISDYVRKLIPGIKIVEACHSSDLDGSIDIWVPQLNFLKDDFEFYKAQQEQGKEVWFYTCLGPQENYANRFIEQPLIKTRILHWINYRYGITGYLHWGLNHWRPHHNDPYSMTTDMNYAGNTLPGGDMNIVYPKEGRLLSSIRLEAMRDGIFDYELLRMLEVKNEEKAKEMAHKIVFGFDHYDLSVINFRKVRKEILLELSK